MEISLLYLHQTYSNILNSFHGDWKYFLLFEKKEERETITFNLEHQSCDISLERTTNKKNDIKNVFYDIPGKNGGLSKLKQKSHLDKLVHACKLHYCFYFILPFGVKHHQKGPTIINLKTTFWEILKQIFIRFLRCTLF